MVFRLAPEIGLTESVRQAGTEQIDRAISKLCAKRRNADAVHETRKAMKRLRALLHLCKGAMRKADFERDEQRIKEIAGLLSGVRDIQAMIETMTKLAAYDERVGQGPMAGALGAHLEAKRDEAEKRLGAGKNTKACELLKEARASFADMQLEKDQFRALASTIESDYRKARRAFRRAYESGEDEDFHRWRKFVQRHWRQLLLVGPGWPKALRPQIALARDLSEFLGEDHDLYVLAQFLRSKTAGFVSRDDVDAYLALCRRRQDDLRSTALDVGARLLAEKPSSLAGRLTAYWETARRLGGKPETDEEEGGGGGPSNVIPLNQ